MTEPYERVIELPDASVVVSPPPDFDPTPQIRRDTGTYADGTPATTQAVYPSRASWRSALAAVLPIVLVVAGVVPQVIPPFLSFTIYRWDINVRMSTIIGFVGGGGIGYILKPRVDLGEWGEVGTLVLLIAVAVWVMDLVSARIRERIV